jgi:neurofibromin 1
VEDKFMTSSYITVIDVTCVLQSNCTAESAELFVNCLEAMVETCLPVEDGELELAPYPSMLSVLSGHMNLCSSMTSLTLGSPTEKG